MSVSERIHHRAVLEGRAPAASRRRLALAVWWFLAALVVAWAAHEAFGLGGKGLDDFFRAGVDCFVLWGAAALSLGGALSARRGRVAWTLIAVGLASWALGDTVWVFRFEHGNIPVTSISDVFWMAWYPLAIVALALLVKDRVPKFELHRWIDGVAVTLLLATPWVALFLQPIADSAPSGPTDEAVEFAYVLGDAVLVGAVVGVYALMGWRPGRMWLLLGAGLAVLGIGDAVYAVDVLGHHYHVGGLFDVTWAIGALLVAYAAWEPHPGRLEAREVTGWRAIALPLAAQALAIGIQIYAYFHELPNSERILTIIVLLIAMVQIVVARPRARARPRDP